MLDNLTKREKAVLARVCMPKIVALLDERDFGRYQIPGMAYARPHLGIPATTLFEKFYAKLSPQGKAWFDNNAECVIVARTADITDTELPYYKSKVETIKKQNGGHLINDGNKQGKSKQQSAGQSTGKGSSPK